MEALIFSDSHGRTRAMHAAMERQITPPDAVFFLGDGVRDVELLAYEANAFYSVRGNCDWFSGYDDTPSERIVLFAGKRILMTHGHDYHVKSGLGALLVRAAAVDADLVLFGHTHQPLCESISAGTVIGEKTLARPMHLFNPGSVGMDGSFGTLTVRGGEILLAHGSL